ncbi:hypothetical protein B0H11DRAFT_1945400 [Mycena galericulata]|nr:hypothetical protein B0H11DRAFT_1945400 [Mycena galericulata]
MAPTRLFKTHQDYYRYLNRLESYRKYRIKFAVSYFLLTATEVYIGIVKNVVRRLGSAWLVCERHLPMTSVQGTAPRKPDTANATGALGVAAAKKPCVEVVAILGGYTDSGDGGGASHFRVRGCAKSHKLVIRVDAGAVAIIPSYFDFFLLSLRFLCYDIIKKDGMWYSPKLVLASQNRWGWFQLPTGHFHMGHVVGVFNDWIEAKASLSGYPDNSNQGCNTEEECIEAWQRLCILGVHPHPVDPAFLTLPSNGAAAFVNTSPRKSTRPSASTPKLDTKQSPVKRETTPGNTQLLADLKKYCSPIRTPSPSPKKAAGSSTVTNAPRVNFAIRGAGIVSSSAEHSEIRYRELQRMGEEPDMLVTTSIRQATLFALEEEEDGLPPIKPGKVGWVHGSKLPFFEKYEDDFIAAAALKETGPFYNKMAQLYLAKYGYNTGWDEDLEEDQEMADDVDPDEDVNKLSTEEGEKRAVYGKTLRAKIGVWFNGHYGGSVQKKAKQLTFKQLFDKPALEPPAPIKPRVLHYYSRKFYDERIKDKVAKRWAEVSHLPVRPKNAASNEVTVKRCSGVQP